MSQYVAEHQEVIFLLKITMQTPATLPRFALQLYSSASKAESRDNGQNMCTRSHCNAKKITLSMGGLSEKHLVFE